MLSQGFGTEEDKQRRRKWAGAAARQEHPKALFYLSTMKHTGRISCGQICGKGCQTGASAGTVYKESFELDAATM